MTELTRETRAVIASKAQAEAHKALRRRHKDEYDAEYAEAKDRLTEEARSGA